MLKKLSEIILKPEQPDAKMVFIGKQQLGIVFGFPIVPEGKFSFVPTALSDEENHTEAEMIEFLVLNGYRMKQYPSELEAVQGLLNWHFSDGLTLDVLEPGSDIQILEGELL